MAGTLTISTLKNDTGVLSVANGMTGIPKAWISFNGSTSVINASFNVASITRNATGDYTITFTTAMANANYSFGGYCTIPSSRALVFTDNPITYSTGSLRLSTGYVDAFGGSTIKIDATVINVIICGT